MSSGLVRRFAPFFAVLTTLALAASPAFAPSAAADDTNVAPVVTAHAANLTLAEPWPVLVMATFTDPDSATESYTCTIDFGDGTAPVAVAVTGTLCTGPEHHYTVGGTYTVTVTITDSSGASGSSSVVVTYQNSSPYVGPTTLFGTPSAGQALHVSVPFTDPGATDFGGAAFETYVCKFDYGDGSPVQIGTYLLLWSLSHTQGCIGPDHVYSTPGTYTITSVVTDGGGLSGSSSLTQTIGQNLSPIVTAPADQTIQGVPGSAATISLGSFTDPGGTSAGPWSWSVDWGDSMVGQPGGGAAPTQGAISGSHAYLPGTWHLQIRVTNAAGASGSAYANVTILDGISAVLAAPDQPVTEGVAATFGVFVGSFGARSLPYQIHMDWGDGTSSDLSSSYVIVPPTFVHTYAAADPTTPGTHVTAYTATATVKDTQGRTAASSAQVGVNNLAPVVSSAPVTVPGGFSGQITLAAFTDPSVGPWHVSIDGDSGIHLDEQFAAPGPITVPFDASFGNRTFTVTVGDRGGLYSTATVQVQLATPQLGPVVVPSPILEGEAFVATVSFSAVAPARCTVDFGNGSGTLHGYISGSTCSAPNYAYPDAGTYLLTLTITDSTGATGSSHATVVVGNVPPVVANLTTWGAPAAGAVVTAQANFSDPSTSETYSCLVNFGDGTAVQTGAVGDADCAADHTYSQGGLYTVTMTVTDSQGGSGSASASVPIANVRPEVGATSVTGAFVENGVIQASASFTDPWSISNGYSCSIDYGDGSGWATWITTDQTCTGPIHFNNDSGTFTVTLEVDRGYGEVGTSETTYTVANVAPSVTPNYVPTSAQSGVGWASSVTFTDPGSFGSETYSCTFDFGDGGAAMSGVVSGNVCTGPNHSYSGKGTYTFVASVIDSHGAAGTYTVPIVIFNPAPIIGSVVAPASAVTGTSVVASAGYVSTGLNPADTCTVDYGDGSGPLAGIADGANCTGPGHQYTVAGSFAIVVRIQAANGATASASATIQVYSLSVGAISVSGTPTEGSPVVASAGFTPVGSQTYKCKVDYGEGQGAQAGVVSGKTCTGPKHTYGRPAQFAIVIIVTGSAGSTGSATKLITVTNVQPTITKLSVTPLVLPGGLVTASATFTDPGLTETYSITWDWGDGTQTSLYPAAGVRSVKATHTYSKSADYGVTLAIYDGDLVVDSAGVAVYDPARTLTGSGTFASADTACRVSRSCAVASTGTFSISAKYAKGATTPTVSLTLTAKNFTFTSTSASWFVAADGTSGIVGTGKVNGQCGYTFGITVVDGHPDSFNVGIEGPSGPAYESGYAPLQTGSITIK